MGLPGTRDAPREPAIRPSGPHRRTTRRRRRDGRGRNSLTPLRCLRAGRDRFTSTSANGLVQYRTNLSVPRSAAGRSRYPARPLPPRSSHPPRPAPHDSRTGVNQEGPAPCVRPMLSRCVPETLWAQPCCACTVGGRRSRGRKTGLPRFGAGAGALHRTTNSAETSPLNCVCADTARFAARPASAWGSW